MKANEICLGYRRCLLFIVLIIFVLDFVSCGSNKPPKKGIIKGEDSLTKTLFCQADMNEITYITQGHLDEHQGLDIGICSFEGMYIVDPSNGSLKSKVEFSRRWGIEAIHINKGGDSKIALYDHNGTVGLLGVNGSPLWMHKFSEKENVNSITSGDLDKNGELEFYVATYDGLYQLDTSGKIVWKKSDTAYDVAIFDPGESKDPLVVARCPQPILRGMHYLQFRNYRGELIKEVKPKVDIMGIEFVQWPLQWNMVTRNRNIYILDLEGNVVLQDKIGYAIFDHRATTVRFFEDQSTYLAVIGRLRARYHRAILCIYSPDGKVFYKEIIGKTTGLLAKKSPNSKCETLLVGDGPGMVYEYRPQLKKGEIGRQ